MRTPEAASWARHVYHVYAIRTDKRAEWQEKLGAEGIQTGIHYPTPVLLLPAYADLGHKKGEFPHSEAAAAEVLSLPMFPEMTAEQSEEVTSAVSDLAAKATR